MPLTWKLSDDDAAELAAVLRHTVETHHQWLVKNARTAPAEVLLSERAKVDRWAELGATLGHLRGR